MFKKCISIILVIVLTWSFLTVLPLNTAAQEVDIEDTGSYADERWQWTDAGVKQERCTYRAWHEANERLGISLPLTWGNAATWAANAWRDGYTVDKTPSANSIVCWSGYTWGHVAYVTGVDDNNIYIREGGINPSSSYPDYWFRDTSYSRGNQNRWNGYSLEGYIHLAGSDSDGPTYDDFHVGEIQSNQFTVMAHVTDQTGVSSVRYAVWTENNGQDDIKWYDGHCTDGNDYYWARINFSDHKGEKGKYIIHMYAYDNAGNLTNPGISYNFNSTGPNYSDFHVGEFREGAFTILAKVTDINGISSVRYAVWTENNGQDDLQWYNGNCTDGNDYYWARVNFADHKNEKGKYIIHMYAYDTAGKLTNPGISFVFPETGPTVTNVNVSNISSAGYTITCSVSADVGVARVQFPTWTEKDGQDDLASEWWTNTKVRGTINGITVTFRVNTSEHNREVGKYITHLYAYDLFGTATKVVVPTVEVPAPISNVAVTDINELGFTVTCDIDTAWGPISKVEFATWTDDNGQDDIIWHQGNYSNGKATCRILTKDHNNTISGRYLTHIYVWDNSGHAAAVNQIDYPCLSFDYGEALIKPLLGDVDGDDEVTVIDATCIQRKLANIATAKFIEAAADADEDGDLTIVDATVIQRWLAQLPANAHIGQPVS